MNKKMIKIARKSWVKSKIASANAYSACLQVLRSRENSSSTIKVTRIDRAGVQTFFSSRVRLKSRSSGG